MSQHKFDDGIIINTEQLYDCSWIATDSEYQADTDKGYWSSDDIMGRGNTEKEAIADYWEQWQELEDERLSKCEISEK